MGNYETVYREVLANYSILRQECFFVGKQGCFLCEEVDYCSVCPVSAAYATSFIGKISPWVCRLGRIQRKEKETFLKEIDRMNSKPGSST